MRKHRTTNHSVDKRKVERVRSLPTTSVSQDVLYEIMESKSNKATHDIYKFPTKFIPEVPRWALNMFSKGKNFVIMDPFCGSGTTLVESCLIEKFSVGIDINPFCQLLSKVKTTPLDSRQLEEVDFLYKEIIKRLKHGKTISETSVPNLPNIDHWFEKKTINDLAIIRDSITEFELRTSSRELADFLRICLAGIVRKVSLADDQSPKPYVSKRFPKKPPPVIEEFVKTYKRAIDSVREFSKKVSKHYCFVARDGDARKPLTKSVQAFMEENRNEGFDLMVTSPPYINAYDLVRTFKLELFWLDLIRAKEIRNLKEQHIGTEEIKSVLYKKGVPHLGSRDIDEILERIYEVDQKRAYVVWKFFLDMKENLKQAFDLILPGGHYLIVIGDSVIRGNRIPTSRMLSDLGSDVGFEEVKHLSYIIKNHYLRIPRGGRGGKIKIDQISLLRKP
ncbi:MAG: DNA methyltransferase [Candidatus Hodarchaeota archaeon]